MPHAIPPRNPHRWLGLVLCLGALVLAPAAARASLSVALTTPLEMVPSGGDFDVFVDVTGGDAGFNGFNIVLSYDPYVLTLLPAAPTVQQQGCLMTGACSASCGETFHQFAAAGDSIAVTDILLCNLVSLSGPGRLYRLHFHAANVLGPTPIRIRRARFYDAGLRVQDVRSYDLGLFIGANSGVGDGGPAALRPLRVEPNPASGRVWFAADADRDGWAQADVIDLQGRVVRHLGPQWLGARERFEWDRTDARGVRAAAGVYLVRVTRGDRTRESRFVLLH